MSFQGLMLPAFYCLEDIALFILSFIVLLMFIYQHCHLSSHCTYR